ATKAADATKKIGAATAEAVQETKKAGPVISSFYRDEAGKLHRDTPYTLALKAQGKQDLAALPDDPTKDRAWGEDKKQSIRKVTDSIKSQFTGASKVATEQINKIGSTYTDEAGKVHPDTPYTLALKAQAGQDLTRLPIKPFMDDAWVAKNNQGL